MMRKSLVTVIGLALLLLTACGSERPLRDTREGPALWKAQRGETTAYIFGTIHVLPKGLAWETQTLRDAIAGSDRLVLEAAGLDDTAGSHEIFARLGQSPGLPAITDRVPPDKRPALEALIQRGGMSAQMLSSYESWAAAMLVSTVSQQDLKLSGEQGVETILTADFRDAGKPVEGLETIEQQLGVFDRMSEQTQRKFLAETIGQSQDVAAQFARMKSAWLSGDMDAIARDFVAEIAPEPELIGPLLTDRNRAWAAKVAVMRGRPFIAVGAAHLAGPDNLIALLEREGFRVSRVQ
ncbi:TraB/GumN family protein [Sphingobium phenoxybenzoativorans]|uniref:TraB/GumN family protein n=1 Tax=Sphingobium phenoxybenzoativorans TaxID=1592790 RepID=UPI0009F1AF87|nr:TraB/GumN family protein [Sphingobium phenoxybenzoativorans]